MIYFTRFQPFSIIFFKQFIQLGAFSNQFKSISNNFRPSRRFILPVFNICRHFLTNSKYFDHILALRPQVDYDSSWYKPWELTLKMIWSNLVTDWDLKLGLDWLIQCDLDSELNLKLLVCKLWSVNETHF